MAAGNAAVLRFTLWSNVKMAGDDGRCSQTSTAEVYVYGESPDSRFLGTDTMTG